MKRHISALFNDFYSKRFRPIDPSIDDLWLVEFPKSGITWLSFMIANVMSVMSDDKKSITMLNINDYVPDIHMSRYLPAQRLWPYHRIIKSHSRVNRGYVKIVYLVRDPWNVMRSYYNMVLGLGWRDGSFTDFIRDRRLGIDSWVKHVDGWLSKSRDFDKIYFVKYEDIRSDPKNAIYDIFKSFGYSVGHDILDLAVQRSSLHEMKSLESKLRQVDLRNQYKSSGEEKYSFVGSGSVKSDKSDFLDKDYEYIYSRSSNLCNFFGYR